MRFWICSLIGILILFPSSFGSAEARSQDEQPGWLGLSIQPVTPEIANALGMHGSKGALIAQALVGGPGALAGLKAGDVILSIEGEPVTEARDVPEKIGRLPAENVVRLTVLRNERLQDFVVRLGVRPEPAAAAAPGPKKLVNFAEDRPLLQLDTGGHMAKIQGLAFTPDGKFIVSASNDKVIRVWEWRSGKTVRTIRGQSRPGDDGKIFAMALSPDARWLAVGGYIGDREAHVAHIRLYDFASGELKGLLKGHSEVVKGLAFSPDSKKLISGSAQGDAIIWDIEQRTLLHRLEGHRGEILAVDFTPDGQRAVTGSYDGPSGFGASTMARSSRDDGASRSRCARFPSHPRMAASPAATKAVKSGFGMAITARSRKCSPTKAVPLAHCAFHRMDASCFPHAAPRMRWKTACL